MKTICIIMIVVNLLFIVAGVAFQNTALMLSGFSYIIFWLIIFAQHNEIEKLKGK